MGAISYQAGRPRRLGPGLIRRIHTSRPMLPQVLIGVAAAIGVLGVCLRGGQSTIVLAIEALAAILLIAFFAGRPFASLAVLLIYVPLQPDFLPFLLRLGGPAPVVRALGGAMEILVPALVVAALRARPRSTPLDRIDKIALGYIGVVTVYVVVPYVLPGLLAAVPLNVRLLAWRADAIWVVLFLACRHLDLSNVRWHRIANVVLAMGALAGGAALYESIAPNAWLSFLTNVLSVPHYQFVIFHQVATPETLVTHGSVGGHSFVRVGSILQSPLALGFYLYVALAIGLQRLTERRLHGWSAIATLLCATGIVVTLTRSALLGALILILVIFWRGVARLSPGRLRLGIILAGVAILLAPFAGSSAVGQRTAAAASGGQDAGTHGQAVAAGFAALGHDPFGRGLGTAPGIGQRFQVGGTLTSEDSYLQVGDEIGILSMVLFVLLLLGLTMRLRRAPPNRVISPTALFAAASGLVVGGLFLHIWLDYPTALTFWGIAGLALNRTAQLGGSVAEAPGALAPRRGRPLTSATAG